MAGHRGPGSLLLGPDTMTLGVGPFASLEREMELLAEAQTVLRGSILRGFLSLPTPRSDVWL